jgi:hypothetical protein
MHPIYAWLTLRRGAPYEWGHSDCMIFMADWIAHATGSDPAAHLRDTYGDPAVCPVGRSYRNDPEPVVAAAFAGLQGADDPQPGDVALLRWRGQRFLSGGIRLHDDFWVAKHYGRGLITAKGICTPVRAWRVPCAVG